MPNEQGNEQRVLVVAPVGRDASLICDLLARQGFGCESCGNVRELAGKIGESTGALLITDEALGGKVLGHLLEVLNMQPPWSDVPLILLTHSGNAQTKLIDQNWARRRNVIVVDRPVRGVALTTAVRAALQDRTHQYQIRDHLEAEKRKDDQLRQLKEAEQRALAEKVFAENIVQTVREPLLVLDSDLRVQSANKSFYELFKVSENETKGHVIFDFGNRQWDIPELRRLLGEVLPQSKAVRDFRVEHNFPELGRRVMFLGAREIPHEKDQAPLILLAIDDITESKELLLKINEELKHIAYATSHDLQEPLRMVVSYTQLLARDYKGKLDALADQFIAYAVEGALRMERMLKDLREYWSVNENWLEHPVPVDCNRVCEEILQVLSAAIQESGASITHDQLPTVMAEEVPMRMLFQNVIGNAIKYRRRDEPARIHIRAQRKDGFWRFSVADNGIGLEAQHLKTIFAPFKRLHGLDKYPGSGIGLAICKKVVERSGGQIWAESTLGQGSAFHFTLPAKDGDV